VASHADLCWNFSRYAHQYLKAVVGSRDESAGRERDLFNMRMDRNQAPI